MTYICNMCNKPCTISTEGEDYPPKFCAFNGDDRTPWEPDIRADERRTIADERRTIAEEQADTDAPCDGITPALEEHYEKVAKDEYPEEDKPAGWPSWKAKAEAMEINWIGATQTHCQERERAEKLEKQLINERAKAQDLREVIKGIDAKIGQFADIPEPPSDWPMVGVIHYVAKEASAALAKYETKEEPR